MVRSTSMKTTRVWRAASRLLIDALETRRLLAIQPTAYDQYIVELIDRARADPAAEAARLNMDLNEGLSAGTISTAAKQPLAIDFNLDQSILDHVSWLRANSKFQHEGNGGSSPQSRMTAAGYVFGGSSGSAENLALSLATTTGDIAARVKTLYEQLFTDASDAGRGHRLNLLSGTTTSVGAGISTGDYTYNAQTWQAVLLGQDFAYSSGNGPYLVGVAYDDNLSPDSFYSPGEGVASVSITARNTSSGQNYTATTSLAGGYQMQVPAGTYTVTATRSDKSKPVTYSNVVVGGSNVKRDFTGAQFDAAASAPSTYTLKSGKLTVQGTSGNDAITLALDGSRTSGQYVITVNGLTERVNASTVKSLVVEAGSGNDDVNLESDVPGADVRGGAGNDTLAGSDANDILYGGDGNDEISGDGGNDTLYGEGGDDNLKGNSGKDVLWGGDGSDRLNGGGSADHLNGEAGNDRMYGEDGDDVEDGGGNNDRCYGGAGNDTLLGSNGLDRLYGEDGNDDLTGGRDADVLNGGAGKDRVRDRTSIDTLLGIE